MTMIEEGKPRFNAQEEEALALGERETLVLEELARDTGAQVAFQGLRRKLLLHQEILSRTLRRLERDGLVSKRDAGYSLTDSGAAAVRGRMLAGGRQESVRVIEALLPPHLDPRQVASHLSGRWFRGLRWYGRSDSEEGTALTWLAEPGNETVRLRISGGRISLETEGSTADSSASFAAARGVLAAVAELYGILPGMDGGVMTFGAIAGGFAA